MRKYTLSFWKSKRHITLWEEHHAGRSKGVHSSVWEEHVAAGCPPQWSRKQRESRKEEQVMNPNDPFFQLGLTS